MSAALISEYRKIMTTRLWWILGIIMVVTIAVFVGSLGLAMVFGQQTAGDEGSAMDLDPLVMAMTVYSTGVTLGYVFPMVMGAMIVTTEFRHRTIDTTMLAEPHRAKVIAAKFIATLPLALIYGVAAAVTSVAVGAGALLVGDSTTGLSDPEVWRMIGMSVVAMVAWMLVGVGFGCMITNQVAVIVSLLAWTQFVEPIARLVLGMVDSLASVGKFLPGAAGDAIMGVSFYQTAGASSLVSPWIGFAVLVGYGLIAAGVGWLATFKRDIT